MPSDIIIGDPNANANRNAYFGDLHVHTDYSFDAYAFGTVATPYDAYRYAQGEALQHASGFTVQLSQPLDFTQSLTTRCFWARSRPLIPAQTFRANPTYKVCTTSTIQPMPTSKAYPGELMPSQRSYQTPWQRSAMAALNKATWTKSRSAWADIVRAAQKHNKPGEFTTFVAYEYTSSTNARGNLHRNVIFRDADKLPSMPFSRFHSQNPEGLWNWMDGLREQGIESMAIPHNSNGSNGAMFELVDWADNPIDDAYANSVCVTSL